MLCIPCMNTMRRLTKIREAIEKHQWIPTAIFFGLLGITLAVAAAGCRCNEEAPPASKIEVAAAPATSAKPPPPRKQDLSFRGDRDAYKRVKPTYAVRLETTKGEIIIDVYRDLAPNAADRFKQLVSAGFYNNSAFHFVHEAYIAQAGISPNPKISRIWQRRPLKEDPVIQRNDLATVSMAADKEGTRATEFYINLRDNGVLDAQGNAPFGRLRIQNVETVDHLNFEYQQAPPDRARILADGSNYLKESYPNLDYILYAEILPKE